MNTSKYLTFKSDVYICVFVYMYMYIHNIQIFVLDFHSTLYFPYHCTYIRIYL